MSATATQEAYSSMSEAFGGKSDKQGCKILELRSREGKGGWLEGDKGKHVQMNWAENLKRTDNK